MELLNEMGKKGRGSEVTLVGILIGIIGVYCVQIGDGWVGSNMRKTITSFCNSNKNKNRRW